MKKLLIKNTRFINSIRPDQPQNTDILITDGCIEKVEPSICVSGEHDIYDVSGSYVSQGFIDMHTHIAVPGMTQFKGREMGIDIEQYGIQSGVTTLIDAGTFGSETVQTAIDYVKSRETQVLFLLNASKTGIQPFKAELENLENIDIQSAKKAYTENTDYIVGIKARASKSACGSADIRAIVKAKKLACELELPLVVHIGNAPPRIEEVLYLLTKGDVVTHCFHGKLNNAIVDEDYHLRPEVVKARERGVLFDIGHGSESFNYEVARRLFSYGFDADIISTDLHSMNCLGPVFGLPLTVSKMLTLDEEITHWIPKVTANPAIAFCMEISSEGYIGNQAGLTIFDIVSTDETQYDSDKNPIHLNQKIEVKNVVKGNRIIGMK